MALYRLEFRERTCEQSSRTTCIIAVNIKYSFFQKQDVQHQYDHPRAGLPKSKYKHYTVFFKDLLISPFGIYRTK